MNEQELLGLKRQIDEAKDEVNKLEGRKEHLMQQLEEDWDCTTVEEAEKKQKSIEQNISKIEKKIQKGTKELEEKYEFE